MHNRNEGWKKKAKMEKEDKNENEHLLSNKLGVGTCTCAGWFVLDLVSKPKDKFSYRKAKVRMNCMQKAFS